MFGINFINGNVQLLGVPASLSTNGPPQTDNILAPGPDWGNGGTATNSNWVSQPVGTYGSVDVPCSGTVCSMPNYARRIPENMRSSARYVRDDLLQYNRTARMKSLSTSCSILRDRLVNWRDCDWDGLWDDPVDQ